MKFQLLDVSDLTIQEVNIVTEGGKIPVNYFVSDPVADIGSKLTIELPTKTSGDLKVSITYQTSPKASGLQWLTPENTLGKKYPYMYSQCQVRQSFFATILKKTKISYDSLLTVLKCLLLIRYFRRSMLDQSFHVKILAQSNLHFGQKLRIQRN